MSLRTRLSEVEQYGFPRNVFPVRYNRHKIQITQNDAHDTSDERVLFHFSLYCQKCGAESSFSGRTPYGHPNEMNAVALGKIASFKSFKNEECV